MVPRYRKFSDLHGFPFITNAQTTNLIINLDHDDWMLDDDSQVLANLGFGNRLPGESGSGANARPENETEVSFFNRELYTQFKANPKVRFVRLTCFSELTKLQTSWDC